MKKVPERCRVRPSPSVVIALLALVIALSAPAQAAMERLANGSVGTAQLKNGAVTTPKLRDGAVARHKIAHRAVNGAKIANGTVGLADLARPARPRPPRALTVSRDDWIAVGDFAPYTQLDLPAGKWAVAAKVMVSVQGSTVGCFLRGPSGWIDHSGAASNGSMHSSLSFNAILVLGSPGRVTLACGGDAASRVGQARLVATAVR